MEVKKIEKVGTEIAKIAKNQQFFRSCAFRRKRRERKKKKEKKKERKGRGLHVMIWEDYEAKCEFFCVYFIPYPTI